MKKWVLGLLFSVLSMRVEAVIVFGPWGALDPHYNDAEYNTTAPGEGYEDSGWDLQGEWGAFSATPIGPKHFITAKHITGGAGDVFRLAGQDFRVIGCEDHPKSDLRICEVDGNFQKYAVLYKKSNEVQRKCLLFGRGTQRGEPLYVDGVLKGWLWGPSDQRLRWGENTVTWSFEYGGMPLLAGNFDRDQPNEAALSLGDSGAGLFIEDDGVWKLAGVNYAVDGPYNTAADGEGFNASLFDQLGLYLFDHVAGSWKLFPGTEQSKAGAFYAARISSHITWIRSVIQPDWPILESTPSITSPYEEEKFAVVDFRKRSIVLPASSGNRFYRIHGNRFRISEIRIKDDEVKLRYEIKN